MIGWLLDHLPWWVPLAVGVAAVIGAFIALTVIGVPPRWRFRIAAGLAAAFAVLTLYQRGRRAGVASAQATQERAEAKAVSTRDTVQRSVERAPPGEVRKRLARWAKG